MAKCSRPDGKDLQVALRHPVRRQILELIEEDQSLNISEVAALVGQTPQGLLYHLSVLARCAAFRHLRPGAQPAGESPDGRAP